MIFKVSKCNWEDVCCSKKRFPILTSHLNIFLKKGWIVLVCSIFHNFICEWNWDYTHFKEYTKKYLNNLNDIDFDFNFDDEKSGQWLTDDEKSGQWLKDDGL